MLHYSHKSLKFVCTIPSKLKKGFQKSQSQQVQNCNLFYLIQSVSNFVTPKQGEKSLIDDDVMQSLIAMQENSIEGSW